MTRITAIVIAVSLILFALFLLAPVLSAFAADITVDTNCKLTDAINAANGDRASAGCAAGDGADTIRLTDNVTVDVPLPEIESDITIEGNGHSVSGNSRYRILRVSRQGRLALNHVTLRDGYASQGGAIHNSGSVLIENGSFSKNQAYKNNGGAIYNTGQLTISGSVFLENRADHFGDVTSSGGAIYNSGEDGEPGEVTIKNTAFVGNQAEFIGGAIANKDGKVAIFDSNFEKNSADASGGAVDSNGILSVSGSDFAGNFANLGGAICTSIGVLEVSDSRFSANEADALGGAIMINTGEASVIGSAFAGNSAETSGGAINNRNGALSISDSQFSGNAALYGGAISSRNDVSSEKARLSVAGSRFDANTADYGGAISGDGVQSITASSFIANTSAVFGGAIESSASALLITDTTFSANKADHSGGGISLSTIVPARMTQLTVVNNAAGEGGGIHIYRKRGAEPAGELHNSLIAGNEGGDCSAAFSHHGANLIEDGACDAAISGDPKLGTLIEPEDGSPAYFPLLPESPAIDAADPEHCTATDQAGTARPGGVACDIGAYEFPGE